MNLTGLVSGKLIHVTLSYAGGMMYVMFVCSELSITPTPLKPHLQIRLCYGGSLSGVRQKFLKWQQQTIS
jgi:hypothetical protein